MALSSPVLPLTTPSSSGSLNPASSSPHLMSKIPPALSSHPTIFLEHIKIGRAEECEWIMMAIMNIGAPLSPHATPTTHHLLSFYMQFSFFLYQPTTYPKVTPTTSKIQESQGMQVDYDGNHEYWCATLSTCNAHYSPRSIFLLHVVLFFVYQPTTYPKVMPITSKIQESQGMTHSKQILFSV